MANDILSGAAAGASAGTAIMPGWGTAIGAVAGGLLGAFTGKDEAAEERKRQEEFARSGIQWRVADAKAAGVHPLFALGASPASFSPIMSQGTNWSQIGQDISRAATASQDNDLRRQVLAAQVGSADAAMARDYATASAQNALAAKTLQEMNVSGGVPSLPGPSIFGAGGSSAGRRSSIEEQVVFPSVVDRMPPAVKVEIPKVSLSDNVDRSLAPGVHPTWDSHRMWPRGDGSYFRALLPNKEASEKMEAMGEVLSPLMVVRKNVEEFGPVWLHELVGPGFETMKELAGINFAEEMKFHAERLMRQPRSFFREWRRRKEANRPGR